jgi:hypothetical protein
MNNGAKWLLARAAMTPSNVGFQITEPLGTGWSFVGQVETQFDPVTFDLLNGPHALQSALGHSVRRLAFLTRACRAHSEMRLVSPVSAMTHGAL